MTNNAPAGKALPVSKPVTITAWLPASGPYTEYLTGQVALFQQSQDTVKVTVEPPGATDKLQASIVAGDPPNVQQSNYIPMFMWQIQEALRSRSTRTWTSAGRPTTSSGRGTARRSKASCSSGRGC